MKVFISQPMASKTNEEILAEQEEAIKAIQSVTSEPIEVLPSYFEDYNPDGTRFIPLSYLGKSLQIMAQADLVYFCRGWKEARGCRIEHTAAVEYGLPIYKAAG